MPDHGDMEGEILFSNLLVFAIIKLIGALPIFPPKILLRSKEDFLVLLLLFPLVAVAVVFAVAAAAAVVAVVVAAAAVVVVAAAIAVSSVVYSKRYGMRTHSVEPFFSSLFCHQNANFCVETSKCTHGIYGDEREKMRAASLFYVPPHRKGFFIASIAV